MEFIALRVFNVEITDDPPLGRIYRPGHTIYSGIEGSGIAHYVEHGIRRQIPWQPAGPPAILVLGDSFTEAHQVSDDEVYTSVLEDRLRANGVAGQVLNLGVANYSLADYVLLAPKFRAYFKPSWIIVETREADFGGDAWKADKPHFEMVDGRLKAQAAPAPDPPKPWERWLENRFALVYFTQVRVQRFRADAALEPPLFRAGARQSRRAPSTYPVRTELELLDTACGHRLTVLLIPEYDIRRPLAETSLEMEILEAARALRVDVVNLRSVYPEMARAAAAPFGFPNSGFNQGHMNAGGHQAAAALLSQDILRLKKHGIF